MSRRALGLMQLLPSPNVILAFVMTTSLAWVSATHGQVTPEEHASHHPESQAGDGSTSPPSGNGKGGGMGGDAMGGMMEQMGAPKPRELYPSLMSLPDLPLEMRDEVQKQAHARMTSGTALMAEGLEALSKAAPSNDYAAMQEATATLREGLAQFESGLAAHRALAEGKAPRNVALQWFKREMNLLPQTGIQANSTVLGLSLFHVYVMLILTIFTVAMIGMYFFKMRRATRLIAILTATPDSGTTAPTQSTEISTRSTPPSQRQDSPAAAQVSVNKPAMEMPLTPAPLQPIGKQTGLLRVSRIFQESATVKTFRFVNDDGGPIHFTYLPGQFLTLTISIDGKTAKRSYTIASSPTQRYYCEISVKRDDQGIVSSYLHDHVSEGDTLEAIGPSGKLTFTGSESNSIVLIGGGIGITPLMSVIRYLTDVGWPNDIYLLYSCRTSAEFVFRGELEQLQRRHTNLHVVAAMTREPGTVWMGLLSSRFTKDVIDQSVPGIAARRIHLCGPPPMMESITAMLKELGVPSQQIKTEAFGPARKRAAPSSETQAHSEPNASVTVVFDRSDKSAPMQQDMTILDVADQIGVDIDSSCRVGACGTCIVKMTSGHVTMDCEDGLAPDEKATGMILACQAKSNKDVVVDA